VKVRDIERPLPKRLEHETQVVLVEEVPVEAETVELVVRVRVVQLAQKLQLLETRLVPGRKIYQQLTDLFLG